MMFEQYNQLRKPQTFNLGWTESRETLSRYLSGHFSQGPRLEEIFANLGHAGRLLPDFGGQEMPVRLQFPKTHAYNGNPQTNNLQAQQLLSKFLFQIESNITSCSDAVEPLKFPLQILNELANSPETQFLAVLTFGKPWNGFRELLEIEP